MSRANKATRQAKDIADKIAMEPAEVARCKMKLKADGRVNCYPNSFDRALPIRVSMKLRTDNPSEKKYQTFGYFTSADVASYIGDMVGEFFYGSAKYIGGEFDEAVVWKHEEFLTWMRDERNQEIIAKVYPNWQQEVLGEQPSVGNDDDLPF